MEKPFTIGFSRQGEMDLPIQYEIVYSDNSDNAMFKWIKENPRDIFRSKSVNESTPEDIEKYGKELKKVSNCCQAEMIPPMTEEEMEDNYVGSNWRAASCYICNNCGKYCEAVDKKIQVVDMKPAELRKGNLLKNQLDGSLIIVKAYDIYCLEEGMDSMIMQPIPFSNEWIFKFETDHTRDKRIFWSNISCDIKGNFIWISGFKKYFEYVHNFQNLYFALTGEDLVLKN